MNPEQLPSPTRVRNVVKRTHINFTAIVLTLGMLIGAGCSSPKANTPTLDTLLEQPPELEIVNVYEPEFDNEPYEHYRIPALGLTKQGTLLAFVEARRVHSDHHYGPIAVKRSEDGGKIWSELQVVVEMGRDSLNNPTTAVLPDTGRVLLFFQRYPENYHSRPMPGQGVKLAEPGYDGPRVVRTYVVHSDDDGKTWSKPREITRETKRPAPVVVHVTGPGQAIVLKQGRHKGRIVVPCADAPVIDGRRVFRSYASYSDDQGETWQMGQHTPCANEGTGNETQVVELADDRLLLSVRDRGNRRFAYSTDGGESWSKLDHHPQVKDSGCMGCVIRYDLPDGRSILLHSSSTARVAKGHRGIGKVYVSWDNGETWPISKLVYPGTYDYSSMVRLPDGDIGILVELDWDVKGKFHRMGFVRFNVAWLLGEEGETTR